VWRALCDETDLWWLPDFHMVGAGSRVTLEPRAGGHLREEGPDGASLLWYTVLQCRPGEALDLVGHVASQYGGPATTLLSLALEERAGATTLRVTDALVGRVSDETLGALEAGWRQLFGEGLKGHAERS